ncbi:peptidase M36 [Chytridium lagenaria]|nr:peptidase M36 [Chytridium lagenaria]
MPPLAAGFPMQAPRTSFNAAAVNVFYLSNEFHDILYQYGFDEQSGNFQNNNLQRGGSGRDAIIATVQSTAGTNNANFATGPDGQAGRMNMFLFTNTNPNRDGDMDNTVVIHELVHGLSTRLTGSRLNPSCLGTTEAGGMGEGWSDIFAIIFTAQPEHTRDTDRVVGAYVTGNTRRGIRSQPYSTSLTRNTYKYSSIASMKEVHRIGEVWSTILFEVYNNIRDISGFHPNLRAPDAATSGKGNTVMLQLLVNGFKLQGCNPTFLTARDAIILADERANGGKYKCALWRGFAKRGLGVNAANKRDDSTVPAGC